MRRRWFPHRHPPPPGKPTQPTITMATTTTTIPGTTGDLPHPQTPPQQQLQQQYPRPHRRRIISILAGPHRHRVRPLPLWLPPMTGTQRVRLLPTHRPQQFPPDTRARDLPTNHPPNRCSSSGSKPRCSREPDFMGAPNHNNNNKHSYQVLWTLRHQSCLHKTQTPTTGWQRTPTT